MDTSYTYPSDIDSGALQRPEGPQSGAHNYRARIEIRKTMRLSFHGHRG